MSEPPPPPSGLDDVLTNPLLCRKVCDALREVCAKRDLLLEFDDGDDDSGHDFDDGYDYYRDHDDLKDVNRLRRVCRGIARCIDDSCVRVAVLKRDPVGWYPRHAPPPVALRCRCESDDPAKPWRARLELWRGVVDLSGVRAIHGDIGGVLDCLAKAGRLGELPMAKLRALVVNVFEFDERPQMMPTLMPMPDLERLSVSVPAGWSLSPSRLPACPRLKDLMVAFNGEGDRPDLAYGEVYRDVAEVVGMYCGTLEELSVELTDDDHPTVLGGADDVMSSIARCDRLRSLRIKDLRVDAQPAPLAFPGTLSRLDLDIRSAVDGRWVAALVAAGRDSIEHLRLGWTRASVLQPVFTEISLCRRLVSLDWFVHIGDAEAALLPDALRWIDVRWVTDDARERFAAKRPHVYVVVHPDEVRYDL